MSPLAKMLPWLEELIEESSRTDPHLPPMRPGEVMIGEVSENLRPLLGAIHHLRRKMQDRTAQYEKTSADLEEFVDFHKEMDTLQQEHDAVSKMFWTSLRMALDIHGGHIAIREDWTVASVSADKDSTTIVVVDGNIGDILGELVRAAQES